MTYIYLYGWVVSILFILNAGVEDYVSRDDADDKKKKKGNTITIIVILSSDN